MFSKFWPMATAAVLLACADPLNGVVDNRLTEVLASESAPERSLSEWVGGPDIEAVCFLDEYTAARHSLRYWASREYVPDDLVLDGFDGDVPEGGLGVLIIRRDRASLALISMRHLFIPNECFEPDAMLRRSNESPTSWRIEGDPLDWR
jgi:hypothetical protein